MFKDIMLKTNRPQMMNYITWATKYDAFEFWGWYETDRENEEKKIAEGLDKIKESYNDIKSVYEQAASENKLVSQQSTTFTLFTSYFLNRASIGSRLAEKGLHKIIEEREAVGAVRSDFRSWVDQM